MSIWSQSHSWPGFTPALIYASSWDFEFLDNEFLNCTFCYSCCFHLVPKNSKSITWRSICRVIILTGLDFLLIKGADINCIWGTCNPGWRHTVTILSIKQLHAQKICTRHSMGKLHVWAPGGKCEHMLVLLVTPLVSFSNIMSAVTRFVMLPAVS